MNCAFDKEKLTGYYDGELEATEKAEVERHIASCSECLRELGELKSAALLVKELPRLRAPRSIADGVLREIAASGRVHVLAKFRRNLMWTAAAAAGLFVAINVLYFARREAPPFGALAKKPTALGAPIASVPALRDEAAEREGLDRSPTVRLHEKELGTRHEDLPQNLSDAVEKRDSTKVQDARRGASEPQDSQERAARGLAKSADAKSGELPAAAAPAPVPAAVAQKPGGPPAAAAKEEGKAAAESSADKATAQKKPEDQGLPQKDPEQLRLKQVTAVEAKGKEQTTGDAATTHLTLATTQIARARPQIEEILKKLGCSLPPPPTAMKGMKSAAREAESTISLELTDGQVARLHLELEKQGETKLVAGAPDDPLVLSFLRGGSLVFGGKKDVASGGASGSARKKPETKDDRKGRDAKDAEEPKPHPETPAEKSPEPRHRLVLHLVEVKSLPVEPAAEPPAKK